MTINTKCSTHGREQCMECSLSVSATEHEKLTFVPNITLSPFDQIGKVDWQCQHHGSTRFMWACVECVKEQLAKEYERGRKEAARPKAESETIKELRMQLAKEREAAFGYYKDKCYLEKQLAAAREVSKDKFQSLCDVQKMLSDLQKDHVALCDKITKARWDVK